VISKGHFVHFIDAAEPPCAFAQDTPLMLWRSGTDKQCDWFSQPWLTFVDRTLDEERQHGWADHVHPDDHERCLSTYRAGFQNRHVFNMEYRARRHDGGYRWLADQGWPWWTDGEFAGFFGLRTDVTQQRDTEEELRAASADRETLVLEVCHRVNNNLQALLSLVTLLEKSAGANKRAAFQELSPRIHAMAAVQRHLQRLDSTAKLTVVSFLDSLLQDLTLLSSSAKARLVRTKFDCHLPYSVASSVALAVMESIALLAETFKAADVVPVTVTVEAQRGIARIVLSVEAHEGCNAAAPPRLNERLLQAYARSAGCHARMHRDASEGARVVLALPMQ
jgi:two-component system, sensor histidine kinase PdtaS